MTIPATNFSMLNIKNEIEGVVKLGSAASRVDPYPGNTITLNDAWVRNIIVGAANITYGTSISMSSFASFTFVNLFIFSKTWRGGIDFSYDYNVSSVISKFFPTYETIYISVYTSSYFEFRQPISTWGHAYPEENTLITNFDSWTSTTTDGWCFGQGTSYVRTIKMPWATEVEATGTAITLGRHHVGFTTFGNATIAYACAGYNTAVTAAVATSTKYTYATQASVAGPALGVALGYRASAANATLGCVVGGKTYAGVASTATDRITFATNVRAVGTVLGVATFGLDATSSTTNGYFYASKTLTTGTMNKYTFATATRVAGTTFYPPIPADQTAPGSADRIKGQGGTQTAAYISYLVTIADDGMYSGAMYQKKYLYSNDTVTAVNNRTFFQAYDLGVEISATHSICNVPGGF
jgi:hypothetical protein